MDAPDTSSLHQTDLALEVVESLNVYQLDYPTLTPVPSPEFIQASIEREALRRIFWLVHLMDVLGHIFFKKPMSKLREQGLRLRLPADETTFELGVSTLPGGSPYFGDSIGLNVLRNRISIPPGYKDTVLIRIWPPYPSAYHICQDRACLE